MQGARGGTNLPDEAVAKLKALQQGTMGCAALIQQGGRHEYSTNLHKAIPHSARMGVTAAACKRG